MGTKAEATKTRGGPKAPLQFSTINGVLGIAGILTVALGYFLLSTGSITLAPVLLVLGYVVLLPLAIIL
jgi:hypothetical protein